MIECIQTKKLIVYPDDRGRVMEILRSDDPIFKKFGQVYMSTTMPGIVKGWHYHKKQWDHICCVYGMIKLVTYDERENSSTKGEVKVFNIGTYAPTVILIPPYIWHGWKCISQEEAIIINTVSELFNRNEPDEVRLDPHKNHIPFSWERKDG